MIKAILISPLAVVPAFVLVCVFQAAYELFTEGSIQQSVNSFNNGIFVIAVFGPLYAYVLTIFYGLPVYYLLKRKNRYNLKNILIAAVFPVVLLFLVTSILDGLPSLSIIFTFLGFFSVFSVGVAYVFWTLAPKH